MPIFYTSWASNPAKPPLADCSTARSPVREEKTPSFWVYLKTNRWHDYGDGRGGDAIDLVCAWLAFHQEDHTPRDALRWLDNMRWTGYATPSTTEADPDPVADAVGLELKKRQPIQHLALIYYLQKRGIPLAIARQHLVEIHVRNPTTGKGFFVLGLPNEEEGYELRNPFFKGTLGSKALTFVRGNRREQGPLPTTLHLFEGVMDYLSALTLTHRQGLQGDSIILNSVVNLRQVAAYVQHYIYRTAYSWLDNDQAGEAATNRFEAFCQTQADLSHQRMNKLYAPHKDVNAWHMHRLKLSL